MSRSCPPSQQVRVRCDALACAGAAAESDVTTAADAMYSVSVSIELKDFLKG
jgi:hypothetical protein